MSRTNIDIDDELILRVMAANGYRTKREAVDAGLRALDVFGDAPPMTVEEALAMKGTGYPTDIGMLRGWADEG